MAQRPVFIATSGLDNVTEPHRLKYGEDGGCPLAAAVNVVVGNSGEVRRRNGRKKLFDGPCHSLWSWGPYCFFVSEGKLYRKMSNGSIVLVNDSCGNERMFFEKFGSIVYCSNGSFRAMMQDMNISSYSASIPQQRRSDTRVLGIPASFTIMRAHGGRMFVVSERFVWESEPFNPRCFNMASGFFDVGSNVLDIISVKGGLYISTEYEVRFYAGTCIADFHPYEAYPIPSIKRTMKNIGGHQLLDGRTVVGTGAIWASKDGVCVGDVNGNVINIKFGKLAFDSAISGAACVFPGHYIFSMETE